MDQLPRRQRRGYARISNDPRDKKVGVSRQRREGDDQASAMGLPIDRWHVDNDKSAYDEQTWREDFEALLADIVAGLVEVVFAWDQDRIARDVAVWERFLKACQRTGTRIVFVTAGEQFITTVSGRTTTRFNAVIARQNSEHNSERIKAASKDRAVSGKAHGLILYGWRRVYQLDPAGLPIKGAWRDEIHEAHAAVVREMAERVLAGETIRAIIRSLESRGITSPRGKPWDPAAVRSLLMRPANAGLRVYQGETRFEADAPAIMDRGDWERLIALLNDPTRRTITDNRVRWLLTGIATCGKCGTPVRHKAQKRAGYSHAPSRYTCPRGCVGRLLDPVDALVVDRVVGRLSRPDAVELLARDDTAAIRAAKEAATLRARLSTFVDDRADGLITRDDFKRAAERIQPKLEAAERAARATSSRSDDVLGDVIGPDAADRFKALPITRKRTVIAAVVDVRILPIGYGRGGHAPFDPEGIEVTWKGEKAEESAA